MRPITSISRSDDRRFLFAIASLALIVLSTSALADTARLRQVRVGHHREFDRAVVELSAETRYRLDRSDPGLVSLLLHDTHAEPGFKLPVLPSNLKYVEGIEAYRVGDSDVALEIRVHGSPEPTVFGIDGRAWRLVVDFAPEALTPPVDASKPKPEPREYVPGDRPIETRMAEKPESPEPHAPKPETPDSAVAESQVEPTPTEHEPEQPDLAQSESAVDSAGVTPTVTDSPEPESGAADLASTLAYFFAAAGDTDQAESFAQRYRDLTGRDLDLFAGQLINKPESAQLADGFEWARGLPVSPGWALLIIAVCAGLIGGIVGSRLRVGPAIPRLRFKLPKIRLPRRKPREPETEVAEAIEKDIDTLTEAVESEKPRERAKAPKPAPEQTEPAAPEAAEPSAEEAPVEEALVEESDEVKESAMDRRVKRVLELSGGGADIESIAKELEMSQDEVKLILDLN